ncbi:ArgS-related anticodon-binding protein NrtL [Streptomyces europaeiscabiei]|uniref:ArgS-related anticodon-binding protein NrtL n=1 Tax=Streptomyces europaeiscabiei TaxID=146819 RepID=UPI0029B1BCF5|nr:DALR anticodon-binding domain-containing protein [Streptomyces europaeiscabiei]MDX3713789.1 DALR anticodon-binding domain-containing protein [Streptomyces europaeiscabiei]MDX3847929.1 DALR anticodon-binding domain-containing protein [Streptomyces europaeiscabiei]MDX3866722.1 DALR anticodon-binding domain-containing protein [Streptomyces europaeiscabiei]MDX3875037.1 DALR anticodon-binding domain-containing protein [Streptomyces europaeiscabiei]
MTPVELSRTVLRAVRRAVEEGELSVAVPARAVVTPPGPGGSGDYATNIALQLARPAGRPPLQVAEILRSHLSRSEGVAAVEITGPGFLNIHLDRAAVTALVRRIQGAGGTRDGQGPGPLPYGHSDTLTGQVVRLRIPYDIRAEVVADALVRIVASQGGRVEVDHMRPQAADKANDLDHPDHPDHPDNPDHPVHPGPPREPGDSGRPGKVTEPHRPSDPDARPSDPDTATAPDAPIDLRPVPAPEDPTPLGPDALRWALLHPAAHDRPRITADHLVQRAGNPLFRVRYAHARARALTRNAAALGFTGTPGALDTASASGDPDPADTPSAPVAANRPSVRPTSLTTPDATAPDAATPLITALTAYPSTLARAATHRAPDRLARHLVVIADVLLAFQHTVLPRGDEKPSAAHRARLALAEAAGTVLAGGLSLLGIDAPEYL